MKSRKAESAVTYRGVQITHPEKILFPEAGVTKGELAGYYDAVADLALPHLKDRLLSLVRCPFGRGRCFYQKHAEAGKRSFLPDFPVLERGSKQRRNYHYIKAASDVLRGAQMNVIEFHVWGSRIPKIDLPDRLIFDLDPGPGVSGAQIVRTARKLNDWLTDLGLRSFVRVSGGKGVHIVLPILPRYDWEEAHRWSQQAATAFAANDQLLTIDMSKELRKGKIFVDYLRNTRGATAVASFSIRAREVPAAAFPLDWSELRPSTKFDGFTMDRVLKTIRSGWSDPWEEIGRLKQRLPKIAG